MSCCARVVAVLAFCLASVGCGLRGPSFEEQAEEATLALEAELRLIASSMGLDVVDVFSSHASQSTGLWFRQDLEGVTPGDGVVRLELTSIGSVSGPEDLQGLVDVLDGLGYELQRVFCGSGSTWGTFGRGDTDGVKVRVVPGYGIVVIEGWVDEGHRRVAASDMDGRAEGEGCWPHPS